MPALVARTTRVPTTPTPTPVALAPPVLLKPSRAGAAPLTLTTSIPRLVARTSVVPTESQARAVPVPDPVMLVTTLAERFGVAGALMLYSSSPVEWDRHARGGAAASATPVELPAPLNPPNLAAVAGLRLSRPRSVPRTSAAGRKAQAVPTPVSADGKGVAAARVSVGAVALPPIAKTWTLAAPAHASRVASRQRPTESTPGESGVATLPSNCSVLEAKGEFSVN